MKRDWDVVREVLIEVESMPHEARTTFAYIIGPDQTPDSRARAEHALLLLQGGYISGLDASDLGGSTLLGPELTWNGHDLLDTLRSKPVWDRIKSIAQEKGIELTFDAVKALGAIALKAIIRD